jgi:hypothetical protein
MQWRLILIIGILLLIATASIIHAQSTYTTTHFIIYNLANASQTFIQNLANDLENAYNLYTSKGMKMALPCSGTQYTIYVVPSISGNEAGVTYWEYTYSSSTYQVINACVLYINISASITMQWLEVTAYHELVHVSQEAYLQNATIIKAYPWYFEANPEGFAEYYTQYCAFTIEYFQNQLYEVDPYSYNHAAIQNYEDSAFFYWLLSIGMNPATIMQNVFTTSTVNVPWLNNYYTQYLLSLVHGQNLCGKTYYPTWQTITFTSSGTQSITISLQGLSAQYYEIELPGAGSLEIIVSGGTVQSNLLMNQVFRVSNTTLYMAVVNPTTSSETITLTINYNQGLTIKVISGSYNITSQTLITTLLIEENGTPISGTVTINGNSYTANNGYVTVQFNDVTWGNYIINVMYGGNQGVTSINLQQPTITNHPGQLYITQSSHGYIYVTINNPNTINLVTSMLISVPPTTLLKPSLNLTFNKNLNLNPGPNKIPIYFTVVSPVQGSMTIYLYIGPNTSITAGTQITPVTVSIINATYNWSNNKTQVVINGGPAGQLITNLNGLSGIININYTTYVLAQLNIRIPQPLLTNTSIEPIIITPYWWVGKLTLNINYTETCPNYLVTYTLPLTINNTFTKNINLNCGEEQALLTIINKTTGRIKLTISIGTSILNTSLNVKMPPVNMKATITPNLIAPTWWLGNLTITMNLTQCPYNATYEVPIYINNEYLGMQKLNCNAPTNYLSTVNITSPSTTTLVSIGINETQVSTLISPPQIKAVPIEFLFTNEAIYAKINITITGNLKYLIMGAIVNGNTTITMNYKEPLNATNITINTGFTNITEEIPRPIITITTNTTIAPYPSTATINIIIKTQNTTYINATMTISINNTQILKKPITLSPNTIGTETINYTPTKPGIYIITINTPMNSRTLTLAFIVIKNLSISVNPFNLVDNTTELRITANYQPSQVRVNATINLSGCATKILTIPINTTIKLTFNKTCTLKINATLANKDAHTTAVWGYLNIIPIYTTIGSINGTPITLVNSTLTIIVTNNGTKLPAQITINTTNTNKTIITKIPKETLTITTQYHNQINKTEITLIVVPMEYLEAKQYETELNPGASKILEELINKATLSGNWTLIGQLMNYHKNSEKWPLTNELMNYVISQYLTTNNPYYLKTAKYLAQYPWALYLIIIIVAIIIALTIRKHHGSKTNPKKNYKKNLY